MALPLGKLTILVGAGLIGSVLAKEGRLPDVSGLVSGAFKVAFKQLSRDESKSSTSKPNSDSLMTQVNILRQELQMLASSRSVTIVNTTKTGAGKYSTIIVVVVAGYGYVWWKGWKLPDLMFATRRSLSDACSSVAQQLESVYASIRSTRRQLSSKMDKLDAGLNDVATLSADTGGKVGSLLENSEDIKDKVMKSLDNVKFLGEKLKTIEEKQMTTLVGVRELCMTTQNIEQRMLKDNTQASSSGTRIAFSPREALPAPSSEPTSPSISIGASEVQRPFQSATPATPRQNSNGISSSSSFGLSDGIDALDEPRNGYSGWFGSSLLQRTRSATTAVLHRTSSRQSS